MTNSPAFLLVCVGPTCGERGGRALLREWKERLLDARLWGRVRVAPVQCFGECATGPNVCLAPTGSLACAVLPDQPAPLLEELIAAAAASAET